MHEVEAEGDAPEILREGVREQPLQIEVACRREKTAEATRRRLGFRRRDRTRSRRGQRQGDGEEDSADDANRCGLPAVEIVDDCVSRRNEREEEVFPDRHMREREEPETGNEEKVGTETSRDADDWVEHTVEASDVHLPEPHSFGDDAAAFAGSIFNRHLVHSWTVGGQVIISFGSRALGRSLSSDMSWDIPVRKQDAAYEEEQIPLRHIPQVEVERCQAGPSPEASHFRHSQNGPVHHKRSPNLQQYGPHVTVVRRRIWRSLNAVERIHENHLVSPPVTQLGHECRQAWWQCMPVQGVRSIKAIVGKKHTHERVDRAGKIDSQASPESRAGEDVH